jgi:hypothetical protein
MEWSRTARRADEPSRRGVGVVKIGFAGGEGGESGVGYDEVGVRVSEDWDGKDWDKGPEDRSFDSGVEPAAGGESPRETTRALIVLS